MTDKLVKLKKIELRMVGEGEGNEGATMTINTHNLPLEKERKLSEFLKLLIELTDIDDSYEEEIK